MGCFTYPLSIDPDKTLPLHIPLRSWQLNHLQQALSIHSCPGPESCHIDHFLPLLSWKCCCLMAEVWLKPNPNRSNIAHLIYRNLKPIIVFTCYGALIHPWPKNHPFLVESHPLLVASSMLGKFGKSLRRLSSVFRKCFNCSYLSFCQILSRPDVVWIWIWGRKEARERVLNQVV